MGSHDIGFDRLINSSNKNGRRFFVYEPSLYVLRASKLDLRFAPPRQHSQTRGRPLNSSRARGYV